MSRHHERIKNDPRWKRARAECLERDGYACVKGGPRCLGTEQLEADHIIPLAQVIDTEPDLAFDVENLQTLCRPCHQDKAAEGPASIVRHEWINPAYPGLLALVAARMATLEADLSAGLPDGLAVRFDTTPLVPGARS